MSEELYKRIDFWKAECNKHLLRITDLERRNAMLTEQRYELMGIAADVDAGNGFDSVCRETLQRVIDNLSATSADTEAWLQADRLKWLGEPVWWHHTDEHDREVFMTMPFGLADETPLYALPSSTLSRVESANECQCKGENGKPLNHCDKCPR